MISAYTSIETKKKNNYIFDDSDEFKKDKNYDKFKYLKFESEFRWFNFITDNISQLPKNLVILECTACEISSLPDLPETLEELH